MPRHEESTASGPSTKAGTPPALTCQNLSVPTRRPWRSAENARPSAGVRPSRRRWQVRSWRLAPNERSSSASRAAMSQPRSARMANRLAFPARATEVFRVSVMARQSSRPNGGKPWAVSAVGSPGKGSRRTGSRLFAPSPAKRRGRTSDVIRTQRRKAVERDRRVGRRIRPGAFDQHLVADLERNRQRVRYLLVKHVGRVAGRPREHARRHLRAVMGCADGVADRPVHRLGEAAELADVEVNPAHVVLVALLGNQNDFGLDDAGVADHAPTRLDDGRQRRRQDRKSTRLNSSHMSISYAVFCLKKKKKEKTATNDGVI